MSSKQYKNQVQYNIINMKIVEILSDYYNNMYDINNNPIFTTNYILNEMKKVKNIQVPFDDEDKYVNIFITNYIMQYPLNKHHKFINEIIKRTGANRNVIDYTFRNYIILAKTSVDYFSKQGFSKAFTYYAYHKDFFKGGDKNRYVVKIKDSRNDKVLHDSSRYEHFVRNKYEKVTSYREYKTRYITVNKNKNKYEIGITIYKRISVYTLQEYLETTETTKKDMDIIYKFILKLVDNFCKAGIIYGDFHVGNIAVSHIDTEGYERDLEKGYKVNYAEYFEDIFPFDFGLACVHKCFPKIELIQFLRSLKIIKFKTPESCDYLENKIFKYYKKKYPDDPLQSSFGGLYGYDNMYDSISDYYYTDIFIPEKQRFLKRKDIKE